MQVCGDLLDDFRVRTCPDREHVEHAVRVLGLHGVRAAHGQPRRGAELLGDALTDEPLQLPKI